MDPKHSSIRERHKQITQDLADEIGTKEARKLRGRRESEKNFWFWLGMMGMVGWAVAVPTLLGVAIGTWIDAKFQSRYSWTLMLLFIGVILGSLNAWYWVNRERQR